MRSLRKREYIVLVALIVLGYGILAAFVFTKVNTWRHAKAKEYLSEAKKAVNDTDKMLLFEKAAALDPGEVTYLNAGITALKLGKNDLAEGYLTRVKTAEGYFQLANAYYNLGNYVQAAVNYQKGGSPEAYLGLGKSYLKQGDIDKAQSALETSSKVGTTEEASDLLAILVSSSDNTEPANRAVIQYNALNNFGYPQAAEKVLQVASEKGTLNRDSLLALAKEKIAAGDHQTAYDYLLRSRAIDPYYPQIYTHLVIVCTKLAKADEAKQYQEFYNKITF